MKLLLLGAPGSGKGTQAEKLAKAYNIPHISTGDILRSNPDPRIQEILSKGLFVSDEEMIELVQNRLKKESGGWVLDGFPRTISQAKSLDPFNPQVLYFKIDDEVVKKRLSLRRTCPNCKAIYHLENKRPKNDSICDICQTTLVQRNDDKEEVIAERLRMYHEKTAPLIEYYKSAKSLIEIPCSGTPDETFLVIKEKLMTF
jgi:adenylate kinase